MLPFFHSFSVSPLVLLTFIGHIATSNRIALLLASIRVERFLMHTFIATEYVQLILKL